MRQIKPCCSQRTILRPILGSYLGERYGVPSVLRVLRPGLAFLIEFMRKPFIESHWVRKPVGFPLSRSFCRL